MRICAVDSAPDRERDKGAFWKGSWNISSGYFTYHGRYTISAAVKAFCEAYPEKLKTIMRICRPYNNNGEAARAVQKRIAPHGYNRCTGPEVSYTFMSFNTGLEIEVGKEKVSMKYGRLIAEVKKLYDPWDSKFDEEERCQSVAETPDEKQHDFAEDTKIADHPGETTEMLPENWPEYLRDLPVPTSTALTSYLYDQERTLKQILDVEKEEPGFPHMTIMKQQMTVAGLRFLKNHIKSMEEPEQPPLPEMRNNDQRKQWLREYKSWGLWYTDPHIGARYYKYDFNNGARLIAEEYDPEPKKESWWVPTEPYFLHLVGGPEPERSGGIPKWTYHSKYHKFPNSETELIEFLKEVQKNG